MPFIALVAEKELELPDIQAVASAYRAGTITAETWIKDVDVEADWESVEERFPEITEGKSG